MSTPSKITLDDVWEKLRWSKYHFDTLRRQIEPFEQRDAHTIRFERNEQEGLYEFYVEGLEPVDPDWGLMIGDCLQCARSALDYILVRLWCNITGDQPGDVRTMTFPIYDKSEDFASRVRGTLGKQSAFSGYLARIEELQPFNMMNPSIWGFGHMRTLPTPSLPIALERLNFLNTLDKHRVVHTTWLGITQPLGGGIEAVAPESFKYLGGDLYPGDPMEHDAKLGGVRFETPLPTSWEPTQVEMKRYFPLRVGFPDPSLLQGVLEVLPWCISAVEAVGEIFRPVFEQNAAPLPVTAVRTIRG